MKVKSITFILGMHRSGTSACTRVLNLSGVDLGDNLMPPAECNAKGFFEDLDAVKINDKIISMMGSTWDAGNFLQPEKLRKGVKTTFENEIIHFIQKRLKDVQNFGLKDPRLCLTLPLWQKAAEQIGVRIHYLMIYRNPLEVAASLKKRDGFDDEKSIKLWMVYNFSALDYIKKNEMMLVSYDDLIRNPILIFDKMRQTFGDWGLTLNKNTEDIQSFISPKFKHSNYSISDLRQETKWHLAVQLYEHLEGGCRTIDINSHFKIFKKANLAPIQIPLKLYIRKLMVSCIPNRKLRKHFRRKYNLKLKV